MKKKELRTGTAELLALRHKFHARHYLDESDTRRMDKLIILLAARVEALEKFVKQVKHHFEQDGFNNAGDFKLLEAARRLLEGGIS